MMMMGRRQLELLVATLALINCRTAARIFVEDQAYWTSVGRAELDEALNVAINNKVAKNVILFIGDGMGPNTVTATRIYKHGESGRLTFEKFPHMGLLKTYSVNKQVPDAASSATAMFTGVKVNQKIIGLDANHHINDTSYCDNANSQSIGLDSLATWAQDAGKSTGFVTNSRITDATPAALYARTSNRKWECNTAMPPNAKHCKDIARQLIEDQPGRNFKVIMGGGKKSFEANSPPNPKETVEKPLCVRSDRRDLIREWIHDKQSNNLSHQFLASVHDIKSLDTEQTEYILGIFTNGTMPMEYTRNKKYLETPSLELMTETALKVISKNQNGFFLMVEGGLIDAAHHLSMARLALDETVEFDKTINTSIKLLKQLNMLEDTLIIVTSDHANSLSINGYPKRGNNILDVAGTSETDYVKYTTLTYSIGYAKRPVYTRVGSLVIRQDPAISSTSSHDYTQQVGIPEETGVHGGSDVAVYAKGPMGHLFHSIHEQNYIAHAIAYATKIGFYQNEQLQNQSYTYFSNIYLICTLILTLFYFN
ncbi:alkaline phosphatase-like isoform X2 [Melanaphis sacchari]|uniref:alkaline phosphatase-like isoform X2 n=1 Tax=Melanaphis sacchari TaxID=742174 RepID=UPI000DC138DD|nr:alkaline phosphatase-like isoform X2 [Melanaphis sacchari]